MTDNFIVLIILLYFYFLIMNWTEFIPIVQMRIEYKEKEFRWYMTSPFAQPTHTIPYHIKPKSVSDTVDNCTQTNATIYSSSCVNYFHRFAWTENLNQKRSCRFFFHSNYCYFSWICVKLFFSNTHTHTQSSWKMNIGIKLLFVTFFSVANG